MHIKQNACLQGFNTSSLLSMLLQMLHMHIDKSGFHFSLKYEVSISIGRLSGGHFALSISRSSWDQSNFEIDGRPLRSIILMFLIFPRAPLLNSVTLTYIQQECSSCGHQFSHVLGEMVLFLFEAVFIRRQHFIHILGGCIYCKSWVILMKNNLCSWVAYFSFANAFFPSKFPQIRESLSRFVQCTSREDMLLFF